VGIALRSSKLILPEVVLSRVLVDYSGKGNAPWASQADIPPSQKGANDWAPKLLVQVEIHPVEISERKRVSRY